MAKKTTRPQATTQAGPKATAPVARSIDSQTRPVPPASRPPAPPDPATRRFKVRALELGYYDHARRRPGDVFLVNERDFSRKWMEPVDPATPEKTTGATEALRREHGELMAAHAPARGAEDPLGE